MTVRRWAQVAQDLPESSRAEDEVRTRADEVLDASEYDYSDQSWSEQVREWIGDFLEWLFGGFDGPEAEAGSAGGGGGGWLGWISWLIIVLAVVALAVYIGRAIASGRLQNGGRRRRRGGHDDMVVKEVMTRTSDQWRAEAERHEAEGRWRDGILCRFRSLVVELSDRRVLQEVVGLTAGELRRDLAVRAPAAAAPFGAAADLFEDVWYGGATCGPDERDRFAALTGQALSAAATGSVLEPQPATVASVTVAEGWESS